jgi:hypothetical protein
MERLIANIVTGFQSDPLPIRQRFAAWSAAIEIPKKIWKMEDTTASATGLVSISIAYYRSGGSPYYRPLYGLQAPSCQV